MRRRRTTEPDAVRAVDRVFKTLTATQNDVVRPRKIRIKGREVDFAKTCGKILDATFEELCVRVGDALLMEMLNKTDAVIQREVVLFLRVVLILNCPIAARSDRLRLPLSDFRHLHHSERPSHVPKSARSPPTVHLAD